jgi:hypothetical protein
MTDTTAALPKPPRYLRSSTFRHRYQLAYAHLSKKLFVVGAKAQVGGWEYPTTRLRVRKLAREMARHEIAVMRKGIQS